MEKEELLREAASAHEAVVAAEKRRRAAFRRALSVVSVRKLAEFTGLTTGVVRGINEGRRPNLQ